jgi:hypothetical protein
MTCELSDVFNELGWSKAAVMTSPSSVEIDLKSIFENKISVITQRLSVLGDIIEIDIPIDESVYSIIGSVIGVVSSGSLYRVTIEARAIPQRIYSHIEELVSFACM